MVKKELLDTIHKVIQNRILASSKILDDIQQSIDAESNSTAGDKHDTSRELMQQERNKAAQNLQNQMNLYALFIKLKDVETSIQVTFGSLISSSIGWVFIGLPLGRISFNNYDILCVSGNSPIAHQLTGSKAGAVLSVNGQDIEVYKVK